MTQLTAGRPEPLGASFDGKGVNFTLFSAHAERVELCVFDGEGNEHRYDLPAHRGYLARLPGRRTARNALRFSRSWSVGAGTRPLV
jgi:glycogen operon protein